MINGSIARRYARALFDAAGDSLESAHADLGALVASLESNPEAVAFFANPTVRREEKIAVVEKLLDAARPHPMVANLFRLLAQRDRMDLVGDIAKVFDAMFDERMGRVKARVRSAVALGDEEKAKLREALARATQKEIELEVEVDPRLLGGMVAVVGSKVYDGSVRTQLASLRRELMGRA